MFIKKFTQTVLSLFPFEKKKKIINAEGNEVILSFTNMYH